MRCRPWRPRSRTRRRRDLQAWRLSSERRKRCSTKPCGRTLPTNVGCVGDTTRGRLLLAGWWRVTDHGRGGLRVERSFTTRRRILDSRRKRRDRSVTEPECYRRNRRRRTTYLRRREPLLCMQIRCTQYKKRNDQRRLHICNTLMMRSTQSADDESDGHLLGLVADISRSSSFSA